MIRTKASKTAKAEMTENLTRQALIDLVAMSREFGVRPDIVLAGGGNTSVKLGDKLFVKASGAALATIDADGFVALERKSLDKLMRAKLGADERVREERFKELILQARLEPEKGQRPSVECVLHHLLPAKFVVHSHATLANMLTCAKKGAMLAEQLFGNDLLWLRYVDPGYVLARELQDALKKYQVRTGIETPRVILMENHGLIVCGETTDEVRLRTNAALKKIAGKLQATSATGIFGTIEWFGAKERVRLINLIGPCLRMLLAGDAQPKIVCFDDSETTLELTGGGRGKAISQGGPLIPDQIVYCQSFPLWLEIDPQIGEAELIERLRVELQGHAERTRFPAQIVLVRGLGLFAAGDDYKSANDAREVYLDAIRIMSGAQRFGGVQYLPQREREFIENWEVEAYRRKIAAAGRAAGRVAGKVAVVTGAAQGFGLQIAQQLAGQGAHVALADVNAAGAQLAAEQLTGQRGFGRACGLALDVTDGASVAAAVHQIVRAYGGFDVFISNAGVLKAESVKTQSERDFDWVTNVNYKGYFLCAQNAAPILALQHRCNPAYLSDIIQINSKSGLSGSNRNFAYAGSKFGGIGLTQSFALELIEDGIKVNSICPGNFFDGPLWSNPDNGLFVQYLRSGKVPGAKTIEDVRHFYEQKVPMGRGCAATDVLAAIYYLIEQQYETGQALPVTGGQVMLK